MSPAIMEFNHFAEIADDMLDMADVVVAKTLSRIHETVNAEFASSGDGPSAPGQPPAIDTGNLANSITEQMTGPGEGEVDVGAEYGIYLEMGTAKMAPRPFLAPAVETVWPEFLAAVEKLGPQ
jgi:HK97 gp10 family phage protein